MFEPLPPTVVSFVHENSPAGRHAALENGIRQGAELAAAANAPVRVNIVNRWTRRRSIYLIGPKDARPLNGQPAH